MQRSQLWEKGGARCSARPSTHRPEKQSARRLHQLRAQSGPLSTRKLFFQKSWKRTSDIFWRRRSIELHLQRCRKGRGGRWPSTSGLRTDREYATFAAMPFLVKAEDRDPDRWSLGR